jgi:5-methylcytosine-specific restriction endonuclease McrA
MSAQKKLIRKNFRDKVFNRDGNKCVFCDITEDLDAHHITDRTLMPNGGYVLENGITLCSDHHLIAETWHTSQHQEWVDGFHPEDLYLKIGSSHEKAIRASKKL